MLFAKLSDGSLIIGLSRENVKRLTEGKPIKITKEKHGFEIPSVPNLFITYGETEEEIRDELLAAERGIQ